MTEFRRGPALNKLMRVIHSYSSMLVLVLLLFFAITGITLNHPDLLYSKAGQLSSQQVLSLPEPLRYSSLPESEPQQAQIAAQFRDWLSTEHQVKASVFSYMFEPDDMVLELDFKRPAGYATAIVDFSANTAELELEFNGYLALLNDLHKGRNAGTSWIVLIDVTAVACIIFALTGFWLILKQPSRRSMGNSLAMLGIFISLFAYILSLH
ncbi:PepSY-associated TM helix domain-containing protein [Rheinheimera sp.]|uniref:PepSY-associated TM helix domain-containing protein n=1 Tax=Rheinheimera sp. TaxID=1869214 RepID=UPI002735C58B|nr:PepSY-associated TM helix domain-containing protein [Rheinheimera sp.]MDP2714005.1 PepSY-associated TM helix domain-containing protein [Rheinheimera sp.]